MFIRLFILFWLNILLYTLLLVVVIIFRGTSYHLVVYQICFSVIVCGRWFVVWIDFYCMLFCVILFSVCNFVSHCLHFFSNNASFIIDRVISAAMDPLSFCIFWFWARCCQVFFRAFYAPWLLVAVSLSAQHPYTDICASKVKHAYNYI